MPTGQVEGHKLGPMLPCDTSVWKCGCPSAGSAPGAEAKFPQFPRTNLEAGMAHGSQAPGKIEGARKGKHRAQAEARGD